MQDTETYVPGVYSVEVNEALAKVHFKPENINKDQVDWEHFLYNELEFHNFEVMYNDSFTDLRTNYLNDLLYSPITLDADFNEIKGHLSDCYWKYLLPGSNRSLDEVLQDIPPIDKRDIL